MFPKYPYLDLSDRNLDFLTKAIREMQDEVKNFVSLNAVKYANPIQWSINRQYEKNTIVIDPLTGTAFISVQPVPTGVSLTRTQYWSPVFDLSQFVTKAASNFANSYERDITTTATIPTGAGDWVVWNSTLYVALTSIHAGDAYVVNGNIKRMTVEDFYDLLMDTIHSLDEELDTEIRNRTDADTALGGRIDDEIRDRQDADTALGGRIDDEIQNRIDADSALGDRIDGEIQNRIDAINNINKGSMQTPEMYGAYGDGVHDDTEACQRCLNENPISYFPNNYLVTNLIIPQGHVLMGGSVDTKGIICSEGSVVPLASAIIMNLRLHSYNTLGIGNTSAAIEIYKPFVTISNVHVINCAQALYIHDDYGTYCSGLSVLGLHVEHCTASIIYITQSNDLYFENCILNSSLDGATQSTTSDGIQLYGFAQAINFVNCAILQSKRGLYCNNPSISGALDQTAMCKFTNCWFDSNVDGVYLQWCRNFDFVNCWFASRDALDPQNGNGAVLHHCEQIVFTACTFDSCNNSCINMLNNSDDVVVVGCKFLNTPIGVYCGSDVNRIVINGNFFGNSKTKDINITMTRWAFLSDQCSGVLLTNNATSGLTLVNNSTSTYNIIDNNMTMPAD